MHQGSLLSFFRLARTRRRLHLTSFDPCRHELNTIREKVGCAIAAGTDGILLGGSTGVNHEMVESYSRKIWEILAEKCTEDRRLPLILFPSNAQTGVAHCADGVLFLSLLNSRDVHFLIREQARAAPLLPGLGLEPVGCGMIAVEPGGTAGRVGLAEVVKRNDIATAIGYATAAEAFGFPLLYLNAGSGSDHPVPTSMIAEVAKAIRAPLIVGGGLTDGEKVSAAAKAGADIVITGTAIESCDDLGQTVAALAAAIHNIPPVGAE